MNNQKSHIYLYIYPIYIYIVLMKLDLKQIDKKQLIVPLTFLRKHGIFGTVINTNYPY